ncbi:pyridoxine-5'-phosphate oxidase-like [Stegodyphus dumicola]|uniref:pyridoxine-5'-phosphate oxidase-like n=1 Tax=Stegodyphus dumicola TaxID=202533 RepID=UPI0015AC2828|nr:pyridoxine-5'-phosphate oxidase-like [Stegodyphus dumicola]
MALIQGQGSSENRVDLSDFRVPYYSDDIPDDLKKDFSSKNPFILFDSWFNLAHKTDGIREANAMAVATADKSGMPSVRYCLLKSYGTDGFCFFTNYNSRKGREIAENPRVALLLYWEPLCRQIRIEGSVTKLSEKESEEYFHSRPHGSQISAVISHQSELIPSKEVLLRRKEELERQYADETITIPKPEYWGGYKVIPNSFEFWCGRTNRLHDRLRFRRPSPQETPDEKLTFKGESGWIYEYLSP